MRDYLDPDPNVHDPSPRYTARGITVIPASWTPAWDRAGTPSQATIVFPASDAPWIVEKPLVGKDRRTGQQLADWALIDGAKRQSYVAICEAIRDGARLDVRSGGMRQTALHKVLKRTQPATEEEWKKLVSIVQLLVDKRARFNDGDASGYTPLYWAVRNGYLERPEIKRLVALSYSDVEIDKHCDYIIRRLIGSA
jgi:hypothetical protein